MAATRTRKRYLAAALLVGSLALLSVSHTLTVARGGWLEPLQSAITPHEPAPAKFAEPTGVVAEGHVVARPGAEATVSSEIPGTLLRVNVREMDAVHKGDLLAELSDPESQASLEEARARIVEIDADIHLLEYKLQRAQQLSGIHAASTEELEEHRRHLEAAHARRDAAIATVERLDAHLAKRKIISPIDGTITSRVAQPGQTIEPGMPLLTVADLSQTRLEAEVNEFDVGQVSPGAIAIVTAEGYPDARWRAKVEQIPDVIVPRRLRPDDPGRPTDTGVALVKLTLLEPAPLRLGQRIEVRIVASP